MRNYAKITPEGTRDYLFEEVYAREAIKRKLSRVFELAGYAPVSTPHMEFNELFRRQTADWLAEGHYHATDSRGRLLVLRPDSTLPIARIAATRLQHAALPLRLYYHQSAFRRSRFYAGHSDEIMQSGVELLGASGLRADLEVLSCAVDALRACEAPRFRIELGHADIFGCLTQSLDVNEALHERLVAATQAKNLPALRELLAPFGNDPAAKALLALPKLFGGEEVFARARELFKLPGLKRALECLDGFYAQLKALGLHGCVDIDLGLVRGWNFYTGLIFLGYIEGSGKPVLAGGRYDNLLGELGRPAAAVGFVVQLDALAEALLVAGNCPAAPAVEALVFAEAGREAEAVRRAAELRAEGRACVIAACETLEEAKALADARGIADVIAV